MARDRSGAIPGTDENWEAIAAAVKHGFRGLRGGLPGQLLARRRGANHKSSPPLTERQILGIGKVASPSNRPLADQVATAPSASSGRNVARVTGI